MLRKILVPALLVISISSAFADTEFEDAVPLELVKALLGNTPYGEPKIYSDLIDTFPEFEIPDGLAIMGSVERGYSQAAIFSSDLSRSETETTLSSTFEQAGYLKFETPTMIREDSGFIRPSMSNRQSNTRFCHDSLGFLTLTFLEQESIVTITASSANDHRRCAEQLAEQTLSVARMGGSRQSGIRQYLPRMELPDTELRRQPSFLNGAGYSGSSSGLETRVNLNIDWSIEDVFSHLSEQINAQGWALDSDNIGTASATASWTRSPESGTDLIGTLTVLKVGEESFELKFQLISTGATNYNNGLFRTN